MTRLEQAAIALSVASFLAIGAGAQTPDLSGTWKLNENSSAIDPAVAYAGLGGNAGVPVTVYVTHARNGVVIVGSDMNTSHARTYRPGGESLAPMGDGDVTMTSTWAARTLVSISADTGSGSKLKEALSVADDGESLRVEIQVTLNGESKLSTLVYERATRESPCKDWPTPCKDWSGHERH